MGEGLVLASAARRTDRHVAARVPARAAGRAIHGGLQRVGPRRAGSASRHLLVAARIAREAVGVRVARRAGDSPRRTGPARVHAALPAHVQVGVDGAGRAHARVGRRVVAERARRTGRRVAQRERPVGAERAGGGLHARVRARGAGAAWRVAPQHGGVRAGRAELAVLEAGRAVDAARRCFVHAREALVARPACARELSRKV